MHPGGDGGLYVEERAMRIRQPMRFWLARVATVVALAFGCSSEDQGDGSQDDCDSSNCNGCCAADGSCRAGTEREACGIAGTSCVECPELQACVSETGRCSSCDASNCLGCCDENGQCQPGDSISACGYQGEQCAVCGGPVFPDANTCYELDLTTHYCAQT